MGQGKTVLAFESSIPVEGGVEVEGVVFLVKDRVVVLGFVVEGLGDVLDTGVAPAVVDPAAVVAALDVEAPADVDAALDVEAPGVVDAPFDVEAPGVIDAPSDVEAPGVVDAPFVVEAAGEVDAP